MEECPRDYCRPFEDTNLLEPQKSTLTGKGGRIIPIYIIRIEYNTYTH